MKVRPPKARIFEHLEERQMLSLDPIIATVDATTKQANLDRMVDNAFQNAADLTQYTAEQREDATRWVIRSDGTINAGNFFAETGLLLASTYGPINNTFFAFAGNQTSNQIIASLGSNPAIQYFYPEVGIEVEKHSLPDDPLIREQWHLRSTGQKISHPNEINNFTAWGADLRAEEAWEITTGEGAIVGVVDDGFFFVHPDLAGNYDPSLGFDAEDGDNIPAPDATDEDFHGTAVAGIIGATANNTTGVSGVAPDVTLGGLRLPFSDFFRGTFTDENIALALT
ncbi:MAG: S8 family serine peptidase, partial [Aeoliella sp.]